MTYQERAEKAYELKASGQCNCAQAVLKVFEDKLPVDSEALMTLASGFAAGMGCMESTCGALVGAVMAGGQMLQGKGCAAVARKMLAEFKTKCGATICKDLKGVETGKVLCECPDCVKNAVLILCENVEII